MAQKRLFRRTIAPGPRERLPDLIDRLLNVAKNQRTDGRIVLNLQQGGVRSVETEAIEDVEQK